MRRLEFGAGERIVRPEEPGDSLYVIDSGEVAVQLVSNGTGVATLRADELLGQRVLPGGDAGAPGCSARSEVVLYRIDYRTLAELLAGHPELAAGLAAIAAARRAALEAQAGGSSAPAAGRRAAEPTVGLIQRLLGR